MYEVINRHTKEGWKNAAEMIIKIITFNEHRPKTNPSLILLP